MPDPRDSLSGYPGGTALYKTWNGGSQRRCYNGNSDDGGTARIPPEASWFRFPTRERSEDVEVKRPQTAPRSRVPPPDLWQRRRDDPTLQELVAEDEALWEKEDDRSAWGQGPPPAARSDKNFQSRTVRPEDDEAAENVLWQRFEEIEDQTAMDDEEAAAAILPSQPGVATDTTITTTTTSSSSSSSSSFDYRNLFPTAIALESHHFIARCLRTALHRDDLTWIRSLPETTFTQILTLLAPSRTLGSHIEAHSSISPALTTKLHITPLGDIVSDYSELLSNLLQIRWAQSTDQPATHPVTLTQYNLLLRSAATLGNRALALRIWKKMTTQTDHPSFPNAVVPDIESYNALMSAVTFNRQLNAPTRHRYRVIPFHMHARNPDVVREADRGAAFKGYSVSPASSSSSSGTGGEGVRGRILRMLQGLLAQGVTANEETWRVVILAAAREGDLGTVEKVMGKVWGVEVGRIGMEEEEGEESRGDEVGSKKSVGKGAGAKPKKTAKGGNEKASNPDNFIRYPSTSPLHPTPSLLTTLAHAYGINNAIPTALKVIDHFSRCYALSIPHATWSELLEWTFVLSVPRTGQKAHHDGTRAGQLPLSAVGDLWETMTGGTTTTMKADGEGEVERKGYNVQPDMRMYDYLVKNLVLRDMGPEILDRMREGRDLYLRSRKAAKEAWQNLLYQGGIRERKGARKRQPLYDHVGKEWRWNQLKALKQKLKETPSLSPTTHPPPSSPPGTPRPPTTIPRPPPKFPFPLLLLPAYTTYRHLSLHRSRNALYLHRWTRLLLRITRTIHYPDSLYHFSTFSLQTLPRFLLEWQRFAPRLVRYEVPGGMLEFEVRKEVEDELAVRNRWIKGRREKRVLRGLGLGRGGQGGGGPVGMGGQARGSVGDGPDLFGTEVGEGRLPRRFRGVGMGGVGGGEGIGDGTGEEVFGSWKRFDRGEESAEEDDDDQDEFGDVESGEDDELDYEPGDNGEARDDESKEADELRNEEEIKDEIEKALERRE
ncbi:hypothetical protein KC323_g8612 [Hortaea werneckii]|nr:hypothetical protein KC323_g8612 [Hortaea werneckii]